MCIQKLTVDADNFDHSDGEEGQWGNVHLDKHGCYEENYEDDRQAAGDPQLLRDPETNTGGGRKRQKQITCKMII